MAPTAKPFLSGCRYRPSSTRSQPFSESKEINRLKRKPSSNLCRLLPAVYSGCDGARESKTSNLTLYLSLTSVVLVLEISAPLGKSDDLQSPGTTPMAFLITLVMLVANMRS